jgi:hypothetical protein
MRGRLEDERRKKMRRKDRNDATLIFIICIPHSHYYHQLNLMFILFYFIFNFQNYMIKTIILLFLLRFFDLRSTFRATVCKFKENKNKNQVSKLLYIP